MMRNMLVVLFLLFFINSHGMRREYQEGPGPVKEVPSMSNWIRLDRAPSSKEVSIGLYFHPSRSNELRSYVLESISNPKSVLYGKYLSNEELSDFLKPSKATQEDIDAFYQRFNITQSITKSSIHGDSVQLILKVSKLEEIFDTKLHVYKHRLTANFSSLSAVEEIIRPHSTYKVPDELLSSVYLIDGIEHFPSEKQVQLMHSMKSISNIEEYPPQHLSINPRVIHKQYNIPKDASATGMDNKILIASFLKEVYSEKDLEQYIQNHNLPVNTFPVAHHSCVSDKATTEASLDVQVVIGTSLSDTTEVLCVHGLRDNHDTFSDSNQEPFLRMMKDVNSRINPPSVVSISYSDDECAVPQPYIDAVELEFAKAAAKGITVVVASGDNGVVGSDLLERCDNCMPSGAKRCDKYVAGFPSSSRFVLSVGGTIFSSRKSSGKLTEVGINTKNGGIITSGGGFSNVFDRPNYQDDFVQSYLSNHHHDSSNGDLPFNPAGRGFPDVSAIAHRFEIFMYPGYNHVDGTSASTPLVAGVIGLLNRKRLDRGQPVLGFINPLLYEIARKFPESFNDITQGENSCGSVSQTCCGTGFEASIGWDPISGLGSMDFLAIDRAIQKMELGERNTFLEAEENTIPFTLPQSLLENCPNGVLCLFMLFLIISMFFVLLSFYSYVFARNIKSSNSMRKPCQSSSSLSEPFLPS